MARTRSAQERREAADERRSRRAEVDDPAIVMEAAAAFLAVRMRSVDETRKRLRHLGYAHRLCDEVVDRLTQLGYLDDEAFARAWVESRDRARPRGEVALRRELKLKGIADDVISSALRERQRRASAHSGADAAAGEPERGGADTSAAMRLIERRAASLAREPDPRKRRDKAYALLARNGFAPDVCASVASSVATDESLDATGGV